MLVAFAVVPLGAQVPISPEVMQQANDNANHPEGGMGLSPTRGKQVIKTPPPPLQIGDKLDRDLTDDELRDFLNGKTRKIVQPDGQKELIKISPGYPVKLRFTEPVLDSIVGDPGALAVSKKGRILVLSAKTSETADTTLDVMFSGNRLRRYQIFFLDNYVKADDLIDVGDFPEESVRLVSDTQTGVRKSIKDWLLLIENYETYRAQGVVTDQQVKRTTVFRKNENSGFTTYSIYVSSGAMAVTFAFENKYMNRIRMDETRLRLSLGNSLFIPSYVTLSATELDPGKSLTGVILVFNPTFSPTQPMDIIWK